MKENKQPINVGDHVRWLNTGGYAGVVRSKHTVLHVELDETIDAISEDALELAPAPKLTPEEAWARASVIILGYIMANNIRTFLPSQARRAIRHEVYKHLGGNEVKVTDKVRERVKAMVLEVADILGLKVIDLQEDWQ